MFYSVQLYGQECASFEGPITFQDRIDTTFVFPIYNLDSTDLDVNQRICAVQVSWTTEYPEDVNLILTSPAGEQVILVGPIVINSANVILETTWDVTFVPLDTMPMPDAGYSAQFNNSDIWVGLFGGAYTGTYHPHNGHIDFFQAGHAYGNWTLRVIDGTQFHPLTFNSFSIEFCNPQNIDCTPCQASADTITPTIIDHCEGDGQLDFSLLDHLNNPGQYTQGFDYDYYATIVRNDTVLAFQDPTDIVLSDQPAGSYEVYGLAVDTLYRSTFPEADGSFTIDSLVAMMDSFPRIFCGDLTEDAVVVESRPHFEIDLSPDICEGDSFFVADMFIKEAGMYTFPLVSIHGCDSIVNVDLTVDALIRSTIDTSICFGDSIWINNRWIAENTSDVDTLSAAAGCDSLIIIEVDIRPYNFQHISRTICDGDLFPFFGQNLSTSGVYRDSMPDQFGCDSVVVLNLDVVDRFVIDTTVVLCHNESFAVGTKQYFASGMFRDTLQSTIGCDSIVLLDLTIRSRRDSAFSLTLCHGDSFAIGDTYYIETGFYTDTLTSSVDCDSIVDLDLTVLARSESSVTEVVCFGDSVLSAGTYYNTTGLFVDTLQDAVGCDSFITLNLTIKDEIRILLDSTICFGDSVIVGDNIYRQDGIYETVLTAEDNCDSIVVLNLDVLDQVIGSIDTAICDGDSIMINGTVLHTAGTHEVLFERPGLCDSLLTVHLEIKEHVINNVSRTICEGDNVLIGVNEYGQSGIFIDTFPSANGCDSIVILDLTVNPVFDTPIERAICAGDSILFNGIWRSRSGIYRDTLPTMAGCDSVLTMNLTILSLSPPLMLDEVLCPGDSLFFGNQYRLEAGIYRDTLISANGCDSLVILELSFRESIREVLPLTTCLGDTILFDGRTYTESTMDSIVYTAQSGCDSLVVLDIVINPCPIEANIDRRDPTCGTLEDGMIMITLDYGSAPYLYSIALDGDELESGSIMNFGESDIIENLDEGSYQINVIDAAGVATNYQITLTRTTELSLENESVQNVLCFGGTDGAISFEVTGGVAPYQYDWEDGFSGNSRNQLASGQYLVFVQDDQGCENVFDFDISSPDEITFDIDITPPSCSGDEDAIIDFTNVQGGTAPYRFRVDVDYFSEPTFGGLGASSYAVAVMDENRCIADGLAEIEDPAIFEIDLGENITIDLPGELAIPVASNLPFESIEWIPPDGLSCDDCDSPLADVTRTITYTANAISSNGCISSDHITIILDIDRTVDVPQAFTPNDDGVNDLLIVHGKSAIASIDLFEIFDRTGSKVFERRDFAVNDPMGWDGTYRGKSLPNQVLVYFVTVTYVDGKTLRFKGEINLIR